MAEGVKKFLAQPLVFASMYWGYSLFNPTRKPKKDAPFFEYSAEFWDKGIVVVEDYLSAELCDELRYIFDDLEEHYAVHVQTDRRIFGAELISPEHKEKFACNPEFMKFAESYLGGKVSLTTTLAGKIYADSNSHGSGGGWHRDSFLPQFKALAYLCDVEAGNGPFQYVEGSHKREFKIRDSFERDKQVRNSPRYSEADIERYLESKNTSIKTVLGKKGSVILCDTSGIHRGSPITTGIRYALTNYYQYQPKFYSLEGSEVVDMLINDTRRKYEAANRNA